MHPSWTIGAERLGGPDLVERSERRVAGVGIDVAEHRTVGGDRDERCTVGCRLGERRRSRRDCIVGSVRPRLSGAGGDELSDPSSSRTTAPVVVEARRRRVRSR